MNIKNKVINLCDKTMVISFCALIYFLPISIALVEIFTALALISYLVKRLFVFLINISDSSFGWSSQNIFKKIFTFFKSFKPVDNYLNKPIAIYIFINLFSVVISRYHFVSWMGFLGKVLQSAFLYFNFIECMNTKKRIKTFLTIYFISCALVCINGVYQFYWGQGFILGHIMDPGRISSCLRQSNDFGTYLIVILPILCFLTLFSWKNPNINSLTAEKESYFFNSNKSRNFITFLFVISLICLGMTFSRGAWLAFISSMLIFGFKDKKFLRSTLILIFLFAIIFFPLIIRERTEVSSLNLFFKNNNRFVYWPAVFTIIKNNPLFGVGVNAYSSVANNYNFEFGGYPHNCYFQMIAETGTLGFISFIWIFLTFFKRSFAKLLTIKASSQKMILIGTLVGLLGFLIQGFWDTIFYSVQLSTLLWILIGLIMVLQKYDLEYD